MGRSNNSRAESTVTLNGKAAENALDGLKIKAKQYRDAIVEASKAGDTVKIDRMNKALKSTEGSMKSIKQQTFDYNAVLKNLNGTSITQLEKAAKSLKNEIRGLSPATQEFVNKSKQLDMVRGRLDELNGRVRQNAGWLARAGDSFNRYFSMLTAAGAALVGASMAFRSAAQAAAEMDDTYADVMKTTGLTREEVSLLNEEFKKLNTRTSREALNNLARDAGKLGVSAKEDVLEFVKAANQINVALGEDLGEGAIKSIGKISEVFQKTKELGIEKAFLSIGSSINALGQASTASEAYLVDFTQRLSGVAYQSGISVQNVMGLASALDQTGNKVEMAATALQKFLMGMFSDTATFAKMAGMEVAAFSKLLQTDANTALITVLKALNEKGGFAQLVPIFKDMGLDGARAVSVLTSMASNIGLVTQAQKLSNEEYAKATSLTNEYNIKDETKMARLEKAKKAFMDQVIVLGEQLSPAMLKTTNISTIFLKVIMAIPGWMYAVIGVALASVVAWKSWNIVIATGNNLMKAGRMISLAWSAAMALVQGNTIRAAAAWKMFNLSFSATALGAIITAIGLIGVGIYKWATYQTELNKATKSYFEQTEKAKREASDLLSILQNSAIGSSLYKDAIEKLTELYGPYITSLINEKGVLTDIEAARTLINSAIERTIGLKLREQAISDVTTNSLKKQASFYEDIVKTLVKKAGLSEDVARIQAQSFSNSIREGKNWKSLVNKIFSSINKSFDIAPFRQFSAEYKKMVADIDAANKQFDFLTAGSPEMLGPPKPKHIFSATKKGSPEPDTTATDMEKQRDEAFKKELDALDVQEKKKINILKQNLLEGKSVEEHYQAMLLENTLQYLLMRNNLYIEYGKDNTAIEGQYFDNLINLSKTAYKKAETLAAIHQKWMKEIRNRKEEDVEDYDTDKELAEWAKNWEALTKAANEIKLRQAEKDWKQHRDSELKKLKELLAAKLITKEQYEKEVKSMKMKHSVEIAQKVNEVVSAAADFYDAIKELQYGKLEQQKERELALYGNTADARAKIEQKFEKEKLALQIKYADKDMAIKIVQSIAAGALAVVQALAQLGPVAGAIAAVFIGATTALQIGTIVAQRNALKSNLQSGNSSDSAVGTRSVKGFSGGGFTGKSWSDREAVGIVHANEWVAPASMVRSNPVVFANMERERLLNYSIMSPPKQFASGGFTTPTKDNNKTDILLTQLLVEMKGLKSKPFKGYVILSEINAAAEIESRIKHLGSL
jgi:TP901 family phage tail tape measure protein